MTANASIITITPTNTTSANNQELVVYRDSDVPFPDAKDDDDYEASFQRRRRNRILMIVAAALLVVGAAIGITLAAIPTSDATQSSALTDDATPIPTPTTTLDGEIVVGGTISNEVEPATVVADTPEPTPEPTPEVTPVTPEPTTVTPEPTTTVPSDAPTTSSPPPADVTTQPTAPPAPAPAPPAPTPAPPAPAPAPPAPAPAPPAPSPPAPAPAPPAPAPSPIGPSTYRVVNGCDKNQDIFWRSTDLVDHSRNLGPYQSFDLNALDYGPGKNIMIRATANNDATLFEGYFDPTFNVVPGAGGTIWYDISVIPNDCGPSWSQCSGSGVGWNAPLQVDIVGNVVAKCENLSCNQPRCPVGYIVPNDNAKVKSCEKKTSFILTFGCATR
ncbi:hypothetical protein H310_09552 [Aphanomyces invadans]|uniref:Thaumatin-like protein n=1 Tax=Aphanomyces invadans TaxID=157072 RepID=A0A024TVK9_9STRA|nr:hypothetical protein H310_09552 [Aphanomyces invadans]ETV97661.1 hypothetical protein H310_09552 [Aphanomyces invadans]|eukprot:XP_008873870.1 hypothetical protein H310_09552 [Aphanomyces invadans]